VRACARVRLREFMCVHVLQYFDHTQCHVQFWPTYIHGMAGFSLSPAQLLCAFIATFEAAQA